MAQILDTVGPWLALGLFYGIPFALAWWLSDGFANVTPGSMDVGVGFSPRTHKIGLVVFDRHSGLPVA